MQNQIQTHQIVTKKGNYLNLFYNAENGLLCVDLIHKDESGGNELVRMTLDEKKLLAHVK